MFYNALQIYRKFQAIHTLCSSENIACSSENTTGIIYDYSRQLGYCTLSLRKIARGRNKRSMILDTLSLFFKNGISWQITME